MYALNRCVLKPHFALSFLRGQFNDLLLIPCALPPLLWLHRKLGLRRGDTVPTVGEIALHTSVWVVVCEIVGPRYCRGTADYLDVIAYSIGAIFAGGFWMRWGRSSAVNESTPRSAEPNR
jgi:hypothetical protein